MRVVTALEQGVVELNYMWLPVCIGMNAQLKKRMEAELATKFLGRTLDEATLDEIHDVVVKLIIEAVPGVTGVDLYLDALKFVEVAK